MPIPNIKQRHIIDQYKDEYEGVTYEVTIATEKSESGSESRYITVESVHLDTIRCKWRESLEPRNIAKWFSFIPGVRSKPRTKEEHVELVMSRFEDAVDDFNDFKHKSNMRNGGDLTVKGDGVAEVTIGGSEEEDDSE